MEETLHNHTIELANGHQYPGHTITDIKPFPSASYPDMPTHEGRVRVEGDLYQVFLFPDGAWVVSGRIEEGS